MRRGSRIAAGTASLIVFALAATAIAGNGIFRPSVEYPSNGGFSFRITKADFNRDGRLDLATSNTNPLTSFSIFLGKGNRGKFEDGVTRLAGSDNTDLEAGLFGEDGKPDLAVIKNDTGELQVFRGDGDGGFAPTPDLYPLEGSSPFGIAVGKLGDDKWNDVVVAMSGGGISVLHGKRNGRFQSTDEVSMGDNDDDVVIADLDRDGFRDVATSDFSDQVVVRRGRRDGTLRAPAFYDVVDGPSSIAAGDLNRDGRPDLLVPNRTSSDVAVLLARKNGTLKDAEYYDLGPGDLDQSRIVTADFDQDGKRDVAIAHGSSVGIVLLRGRGDGRLRLPQTYETEGNSTGLVVGSLRDGGGPDLATANRLADGSISVLINR